MENGERRGWLGLVLAGLAGAGLTALFLARFHPAAALLSSLVPSLAAALVLLLGCVSAGDLGLTLAERILPGDEETARSLSERILIGFATLGTVLGIVAWIGFQVRLVVIAIIAIAALHGLVVAIRSRPWTIELEGTDIALLAIPVVVAFVEAVTPVNSPDELVYKLGVAHEWLLRGRMVELPLLAHSYGAMALQLAGLGALVLGGGIAAKLMHFGIYIAALLVIRTLAQRVAPRAAIWIVAVLAWTPALMLIAGWCWTEWGSLGLLVLSLDYWQRGRPGSASAALGAGIAVKYIALPWLAAFGLVLMLRNWRILPRAILLIVLFGSFFYIRNLVWSGSPVAPLLLPNAPAVVNYKGGQPMSGWRDLVRGGDVFDPDIVDESLGIILPLAFLTGLVAAWRRRDDLRDLALLGALQMPLFLTIGPGSRNMITAVAPVAMAGVPILHDWWSEGRRFARQFFGLFLVVAMAGQLVLCAFVLDSYDLTRYLAGRETTAEYIGRQRAFAAPYTWIARSTPANARLLLLGENRSYYLERQSIHGGNLDGPRVVAWLARFPTPDLLFGELRQQGVTHVLVHQPWFRVASPTRTLGMVEKEFVTECPPAVARVVSECMKTHGALRYRDSEYLIFELR